MDERMNSMSMEEYLCSKATLANVPISGSLELTPLCNMSCDMCYIRMSEKEMQQVGRMRTMKEWVTIATDMKNQGTIFLLLTGGEPLRYPNFLELYQELIQLGFIITINTNGTLWTENQIRILSKSKPRRVNITLYGASNDTYKRVCHNRLGFDQTIHTIKLMQQYEIPVKLNGTICPENIRDIPELLRISKELELPIEIDTYMFPFRRSNNKEYCQESRLSPLQTAEAYLTIKELQETKERWNQYVEYIKKYREASASGPALVEKGVSCRAGRSSFWITWRGEMLPCFALGHNPINIDEHGCYDAWKILVEDTANIPSAAKCSVCPKKELCMICPGRAYCETSKVDESAPFLCEYTDAIIESVVMR